MYEQDVIYPSSTYRQSYCFLVALSRIVCNSRTIRLTTSPKRFTPGTTKPSTMRAKLEPERGSEEDVPCFSTRAKPTYEKYLQEEKIKKREVTEDRESLYC